MVSLSGLPVVLKIVRTCIKLGVMFWFYPAWTELTARDEEFIRKML